MSNHSVLQAAVSDNPRDSTEPHKGAFVLSRLNSSLCGRQGWEGGRQGGRNEADTKSLRSDDSSLLSHPSPPLPHLPRRCALGTFQVFFLSPRT